MHPNLVIPDSLEDGTDEDVILPNAPVSHPLNTAPSPAVAPVRAPKSGAAPASRKSATARKITLVSRLKSAQSAIKHNTRGSRTRPPSPTEGSEEAPKRKRPRRGAKSWS